MFKQSLLLLPKLLLPLANGFVEIFSDCETRLKKLGPKLTKMFLLLSFQLFSLRKNFFL